LSSPVVLEQMSIMSEVNKSETFDDFINKIRTKENLKKSLESHNQELFNELWNDSDKTHNFMTTYTTSFIIIHTFPSIIYNSCN